MNIYIYIYTIYYICYYIIGYSEYNEFMTVVYLGLAICIGIQLIFLILVKIHYYRIKRNTYKDNKYDLSVKIYMFEQYTGSSIYNKE